MKKKNEGVRIGKISHVRGGQINIAGRDIRQDHQAVEIGGGEFVKRDKITRGESLEEIIKLFDEINRLIDAKQNLSTQAKVDLKADVNDIQVEVKKGDRADSSFIGRRLRNIKRMAPDISDIIIAAFTGGPTSVITTTLKKIAQKIKDENTK